MKRLLLLPAAFSMLAGSACGASRGTEVSVGAPAPAVAGTYFSSGDAAPSPTRVSLTNVGAPFTSGAAIAVPGPDGTTYYQAWEPSGEVGTSDAVGDGVVLGEASVRLHAKGGHDTLLSDGSLSFAVGVGPRPQLALATGSSPEVVAGRRPLVGLSVVPIGDDLRTAVSWSAAPGPYQIYAWAGERLLVQRLPLDSEGPGDVVVFDGPNAFRELQRDATAIAVSPDARRVLTWSATAGGGELGVIDLASGRKDAVMSADWATVTSAAWHGQTVALAAVRDSRPLIATAALQSDSLGRTREMEVGKAGGWAAVFDLWISDRGDIGGIAWPVTIGTEALSYGLLRCSANADACSAAANGVLFDQQFGRVRNPSRAAGYEPVEEQR